MRCVIYLKSSLSSVFFAFICICDAQYNSNIGRTNFATASSPSVSSKSSVVVSPYLHALSGTHSQRPIKRLQAAGRTVFPSADILPNLATAKVKSTKTSNFNVVSSPLQNDAFDSNVIVKHDSSAWLGTSEELHDRIEDVFAPLLNGETRHVSRFGSMERYSRMKRRKAATKMNDVLDSNGEKMIPLTELEIKSDGELQKMLYRTTMKTTNYSQFELTTPLPFSTTTLSSLFGVLYSVPQTVTLPSLIGDAAVHTTQQHTQPSSSAISAGKGNEQQKNTSTDQFEQLGCGWDLLTQSCKDVFQFGWCNQCKDFGNVFFHDCKCVAVTTFYKNTVAAFANAAAANGVVLSGTNATAFAFAAPLIPGQHVQGQQLAAIHTPHASQLPLAGQRDAFNDPFQTQHYQQQTQQQQSQNSALTSQPILLVPVQVPIPLSQQQQQHQSLPPNPFAPADLSQPFAENRHSNTFQQAPSAVIFGLQQQQHKADFAAPSNIIAQPQPQTIFPVSNTRGTSPSFMNPIQPYSALQPQSPSAALIHLV